MEQTTLQELKDRLKGIKLVDENNTEELLVIAEVVNENAKILSQVIDELAKLVHATKEDVDESSYSN